MNRIVTGIGVLALVAMGVLMARSCTSMRANEAALKRLSAHERTVVLQVSGMT